MNRRLLYFAALATMLAALCVHLGFWQLRRLGERRGLNEVMRARIAQEVSPVERLSGDSSELRYRRVTVAGVPDYEHEIALTGRSNRGSPGVHVLTPVRVTGLDSAVLVNRGWVYAPDAANADLSRWREQRTAFTGYVETFRTAEQRLAPGELKLRAPDREAIAGMLPYPVARVYVVSQDRDTTGAPIRVPAPALNDGPHLSYAVQWFSFAAVAVIGTAVVLWRERREHAGSTAA